MIEKALLKQILTDQRESLLNRPSGIRREILDRIIELKRTPHVTVLTGMRRSGKSTLLKQIINELYSEVNYYYISFEDERLSSIQASEFNVIYETLAELFGQAKTFFIDEIQNVPQFESFVRRLYDSGFKFYITGSNANLLSREIGTKLTGRHLDIEVKPFNFPEYLAAKGKYYKAPDIYSTRKKVEIKKLFYEYLVKGGIPEAVIYGDSEITRNIYEDIVIKDIVARYSVNDIKRIKELYSFLITNCGQKFSYNSLKNSFNYGSGNTVRDHIHYLEETYLIRVIDEFNFSLKKQIRSDKKVYVIDNGIQRIISTKFTENKGWMLENLFAALLPSKNKLYYSSANGDCDFIFTDGKNKLHPIQITWELTPANRDRELNGIYGAMEGLKVNKGYIFTFESEEVIKSGNKIINVIPLWKWLIERNVF